MACGPVRRAGAGAGTSRAAGACGWRSPAAGIRAGTCAFRSHAGCRAARGGREVAARRGLLDLLDFQAEPESWREFAGLGGRRWLRPMRSWRLAVGEYELRWFIEVDRASESLPVIVRKCRLYAEYYQSGTEQAARRCLSPRLLGRAG